MLKAIFFDLSGVLYVGGVAIPGAVEAVAMAKASPLHVRFVTNTSRRNTKQVLNDLQSLGFDVSDDELFTAPAATLAWLKQNKLRPYCLIHQNIRGEFSAIDKTNPNAVVIGDAASDFCYDKLNRAFQLCQQGAPLIGIGYNRFFKLDGQLLLDAGPFIKAIEFAASTKATIIGKPSPVFFRQIIDSIQGEGDIRAHEVLMVGDDIFGDIEGAVNAGLQGCLVCTGKYQKGDEDKTEVLHFVADSVVEAVNFALSRASSS